MSQMIRVTCPYCKSSGYIAAPLPGTILMGPCPICGEPVALYASKVIGLRREVFGKENFGERIQSLARIIMEYINSHEKPLEEIGLERIIREAEDRMAEEYDRCERNVGCRVSPSVRNPAASPISEEEVEDFLKIDLNLLARKEYFDRFFG
ncbi:MAG: hypothetical protein Kow0099_34990 [Candidatus Abyssubacteria bacterium]